MHFARQHLQDRKWHLGLRNHLRRSHQNQKLHKCDVKFETPTNDWRPSAQDSWRLGSKTHPRTYTTGPFFQMSEKCAGEVEDAIEVDVRDEK